LAAGFNSACWTSLLVQQLILREFNVLYNRHYVCQLLHNLGFSYQKAKFVSDHLDQEKRAHWLAETWPHKDTDHTHHTQTQPLGGVPALFFVQQGQVSVEFQRQCDRFGFATVQIAPQCRDQSLILCGMSLNPVCVRYLLTTGPSFAPGVQFLPHTTGNVLLLYRRRNRSNCPIAARLVSGEVLLTTIIAVPYRAMWPGPHLRIYPKIMLAIITNHMSD